MFPFRSIKILAKYLVSTKNFYPSLGNGRFCHYVTLGIRREDKNVWEQRTPLPPSIVANLLENFNNNIAENSTSKVSESSEESPAVDKSLTVIVQPCKKRVYSDSEYQKVLYSYRILLKFLIFV